MAQKIYALLVGIDDYPEGVGTPKLSGCINDVNHFRDDYLKKQFPKSLALAELQNGQATRENIIREFRNHLGKAGEGDVAVFHYCGHGGQSVSAPEFRAFDPTGLDEGLVCIDSRRPNGAPKGRGYDLADKELAVLINEVASKGAHVAFILDSCHSGSGTRSADAIGGLRSRLASVSKDPARALDSYLDGYYTKLLKKGESLSIPAGSHILLAACERRQEAKEDPANHRGVFTSTLLEVLNNSKETLSYPNLFVRCRAAVRKRADNQDPQFEIRGSFDAWSGFLGQAAGAKSAKAYSVIFDIGKDTWKIDAGAIDGMSDQPDQPVSLALYDENDQSVGTAKTVEVGPDESFVELDFESNNDARFRAAITSMPAAPLLLHVEAEAGLREKLQKELEGGAVQGVAVTEEANSAHYALQVQDGKLALRRRESDLLIVNAVLNPSDPKAAVKALAEPIQRVSQWERLLALRNRASGINPDSIDFVLSESESPTEADLKRGEEATLESVKEAGGWSEIQAYLLVRNKSGQDLHMLLAHFQPDFEVTVEHNALVPNGDDWVKLFGDEDLFGLEPGHETEESIDRFKLIASTEKVEDYVVAQAGLKLGSTVGATRATRKKNKKARRQDWMTKSLRVRVSPRLSELGAKDWKSDNGAIVVKGHSKVKASVSMAPARPSTRSATEGAPFLEAFERAGLSLKASERAGLSVASFGHTRGGELNVLELSGIENPEALATEPLRIKINETLADNEALLPIVWNGSHVLLGGEVSMDDDGAPLISINHIPEAPSDRRSLGGSLKLYFFKTFLKRDNVNQLRWVDYKSDGSFEYQKSMVADKVGAAHNILLLVHGITGDTEGMAKGVKGCGLIEEQKFDLVLTYDYENLSTPIEETAKKLKAQLAEAGLHENDDKRLTLLVHSMGGLVSREFIEHQGGNKVVDHLVMCGTPNNGSPFGEIDGARKILNVLTGVSLNFFPALIPFSGAALWLLNRSKKLTPTLEQMNPASDFIKNLNSSEDPGIPYTILAGDVDAYKPTDQFFDEMLAKAGQSFIFDALYASQANDIAVAVESIRGVGGQRKIAPIRMNVACHHMNYFVSESGQKALMEVEWSK